MRVQGLQVTDEELAIVRGVLGAFVPGREVWAFGSRVSGRSKKFSDLDLVILGEERLGPAVLSEMADAFTESDLPFKVDVLEWGATSQKFREIIEAGYRPL